MRLEIHGKRNQKMETAKRDFQLSPVLWRIKKEDQSIVLPANQVSSILRVVSVCARVGGNL